jgi:membrane protease subunit (stomatin/prohibitin family)
VRAKAAAEFEAIGLELKTFVIASMTPSENTAEELRSRGLLDAQMYAQLQAADAMREALCAEDWGAVALCAVKIAQQPQIAAVTISPRHRMGRPWQGAWKRYRRNNPA